MERVAKSRYFNSIGVKLISYQLLLHQQISLESDYLRRPIILNLIRIQVTI